MQLRRRPYRWTALIALLVTAAAAPAVVFAQQDQVIEGEILDPAAYLKDGRHGSETTDQTYEAVDGGQTLALLDDKGALYLLLAEEAGEDPNEFVYDSVNKHVKVKGRIYERGGVRGVVITSVEPADAVLLPLAPDAPENP